MRVLIHSHTAAWWSVRVMPIPAPEAWVPCPLGPRGKMAIPRSNLTRSWPGFLYSETSPGVWLRAARVPWDSNMASMLGVR